MNRGIIILTPSETESLRHICILNNLPLFTRLPSSTNKDLKLELNQEEAEGILDHLPPPPNDPTLTTLRGKLSGFISGSDN